jgi:tetratricopeptide (TPR) repeat protein
VGRDRAVVALTESVLVLTPNGATVLVGMHARCSWDGTSLYLLDESSGLIWQIRGVEKLGTRVGDLAHADELVQSLPPNAANDSPAVLEAARNIGCNEVTRLRSESHAQSKTTATAVMTSTAKMVLAYLDESNRQVDQGDYAAAIETLQRALEIDRNNAAAKGGLERARRAMTAENELVAVRARGSSAAVQASSVSTSTIPTSAPVTPVITPANEPSDSNYWWWCNSEYFWNPKQVLLVSKIFQGPFWDTVVQHRYETSFKTWEEGLHAAIGKDADHAHCQFSRTIEDATRSRQNFINSERSSFSSILDVKEVDWSPSN